MSTFSPALFGLLLALICWSSQGFAQVPAGSAAVLQASVTTTDSTAADSVAAPAVPINAQALALDENLDFVEYLLANALYADAILVLKAVDLEDEATRRDQRDSVRFYLGWIHYFSQEFSSATEYLSGIDPSSVVFDKAVFFRAISHAYLAEYDQARRVLSSLKFPAEHPLYSLRLFELSGLALLQRDTQAYRAYSDSLGFNTYLFATEKTNLDGYMDDMSHYKKRRPWVAGLVSALVPGLGKYYAGYRGLPFGALSLNLPLAIVAAEVLIIAGPVSIPFAAAALAFGVFYTGNIWGSVLSVNSFKYEFNAELDHNILYDIHIPLRRTFE